MALDHVLCTKKLVLCAVHSLSRKESAHDFL